MDVFYINVAFIGFAFTSYPNIKTAAFSFTM